MTAYDRAGSALRHPVGLALSGGGLRATLFHLGAVVRMNELRLLRELDEIAGVSGGAIVAGRLAVVWRRLRFRIGVATNLWEELAAPLIEFAGRRVDVGAVTRALVPGALEEYRSGRKAGTLWRTDADLGQYPVAPAFAAWRRSARD
jgi:hypothetical protein